MSEDQIEKFTNLGIEYGLKLIAALAIFIIGKWIAKLLTSWVKKLMIKSKVDEALVSFVSNIIYALLITFVVIAAANKVGVQTTSLVAVIGAAGLAIGMALSGSLSNFASGVMIIVFKPFKKGDLIEAAGILGVVEEIGILCVIMKSGDNKQIIVPNSSIMGGAITNYSGNNTRRVDMVFGVSYSDDIKKVETVINEVLSENSLILKDPAPTVAVSELADNSVNFVVRPWGKTADYWTIWFETHKNIKLRFDKEGISFPFPQRDVHLIKED
jgi:small conductance mechanosensitive channel